MFLLLTFTPSLPQWERVLIFWKCSRILVVPCLLVPGVPVCEKVTLLSGYHLCVSPVIVAWVVRTRLHSSFCVSAGLISCAVPLLSCFLILLSFYLALQPQVTPTLHLASRIPLSYVFFYLMLSWVFLISLT